MTKQNTEMLGHTPMHADLLSELAVNPQLLNAVLTPPIAFNPLFVDIADSLAAGLLLSLFIDDPQSEQWSALDAGKILRSTRMTPAELRGARQRLRDACLLEERRAGFPARTEYRVNFDELKLAILANVRKPASNSTIDTPTLAGLNTQLH